MREGGFVLLDWAAVEGKGLGAPSEAPDGLSMAGASWCYGIEVGCIS